MVGGVTRDKRDLEEHIEVHMEAGRAPGIVRDMVRV